MARAAHLCGVIGRALQRQFAALGAENEEGGGSGERGGRALSLFALTGRMTRRQAAKLFYQICGARAWPLAHLAVPRA